MTGQDASNATHRAFEHYLDQHLTNWKPIPVGPDPSADYRLTSATSEITCEVKTLFGKLILESGGYDPCKPIVRKIRKARRQLNGSEGEPRCVVLNSKSVYDSLDPTVVACAAFGPGFVEYRPDHSVIDGSPPVLRFSRRKELPERLWHLSNAALSPVCNTRISALVILRDYELSDRNLAVWRQLEDRQRAGEIIRPGESLRILSSQYESLPNTRQYQGTVRAIVLENPHARTPFADDLFRGPFDQRWCASGDLYGPVWIGSTLETLFADRVPFHML
jgi:hypothetical protein